ncbi:GNAT family N-acetyltransferase [Flavitalea flava]
MGIRIATPQDAKAIQSLLEQLEYPGTENFLVARLEKLLTDPAEQLLVYEKEESPGGEGGRAGEERPWGEEKIMGNILGVLSLHFIPQLAVEGDFARISYFSVDESARSEGIGKKMEEYCARMARERGCQLIEVHCHTRRTEAHRFYARQGYEESPKYLVKRLRIE